MAKDPQKNVSKSSTSLEAMKYFLNNFTNEKFNNRLVNNEKEFLKLFSDFLVVGHRGYKNGRDLFVFKKEEKQN